MTTVLVTGCAGFIGAFLSRRLVDSANYSVVGIDNLNAYYDVQIKRDRLRMITSGTTGEWTRFAFHQTDLVDEQSLMQIFSEHRPDIVVHLGAQAGVRYSVDAPRSYIDSNLIGFFNILEACRRYPVAHLIYASSSSVYGRSSDVPYAITDRTDCPVSLYAATKKANEVMASAYADLYGILATGLRFFTVYGPLGRPDMAYFKFTDRMVSGEPIEIFNFGDLKRDFTYVDDVVGSIESIVEKGFVDHASGTKSNLYNIGNSQPVGLLDFVHTLEQVLIEEGVVQKKTEHILLPMQIGDVYETYADVSDLERDYAFRPATPLRHGLREFARWYKVYRNL